LHYWHVSAIDTGGVSSYSSSRTFTTGTTDAVDEVSSALPREFALMQNYPDPFNPTTVIRYKLPFTCSLTLKVFDVLGREVVTLVDGIKSAGNYFVTFDGNRLSSGLYLYRLEAGSYTATQKMLLVK
jgi:hypothetical protein